jgi:hypothetical protein
MSEELKFTYGISEDKTKLGIVFQKPEHVLTADDIRTLMVFLAMQREKMKPDFPIDVASSHPAEIFKADSYSIANHPDSGTAQVFLRIPGLGWATAEFPPDICAELSRALARSVPAPAPGSAAH